MSQGARALPVSRWWLVAAAALAMGVGGTYQFLWSSLRDPLSLRLGTSGAALGSVFTVYVLTQTLSQFPAGWVRDRYGPRRPLALGALLLAGGFAGVATLTAYPAVLASYAVGGVGLGITYTVAVNTPVKWFDDRRGLATGLVTMSFGTVSFVAIPLVRGGIESAFTTTVLGLAAVAGLGTLAAAVVLRDPPNHRGGAGDDTAGTAAAGPGTDASPPPLGLGWRTVVRTWQFWLLYGVLVANNLVGLMIIGKVVSLAGNLGLSAGAATAAASLVAIGEGGGVLTGGAAADRFGRRRVVAVAMVLAAGSLAGGVLAGEAGLDYVFAVGIAAAAFFRTPVFAVFPALVAEYYGTARSSENYALLYTAKLWGGLGAGAVASAVVAVTGWSAAFLAAAGILAAAGLAMTALRPYEHRRAA